MCCYVAWNSYNDSLSEASSQKRSEYDDEKKISTWKTSINHRFFINFSKSASSSIDTFPLRWVSKKLCVLHNVFWQPKEGKLWLSIVVKSLLLKNKGIAKTLRWRSKVNDAAKESGEEEAKICLANGKWVMEWGIRLMKWKWMLFSEALKSIFLSGPYIHHHHRQLDYAPAAEIRAVKAKTETHSIASRFKCSSSVEGESSDLCGVLRWIQVNQGLQRDKICCRWWCVNAQ